MTDRKRRFIKNSTSKYIQKANQGQGHVKIPDYLFIYCALPGGFKNFYSMFDQNKSVFSYFE